MVRLHHSRVMKHDVFKPVKLSSGGHALAAADQLPAELKIFSLGSNPSDIGDVLVNDVSLAALEKQVAGKSFARIVIDFEHSSEPGTEKYIPPPRRHAGYGTLVPLAGKGVFLRDIRWTKSGEQYAREYADMSPTVKLSDKGEVLFVKSLALCPNGAVHDLTFLSSDPSKDDAIEQEIQDMEGLKVLEAAVNTQKQSIEELTSQLKAIQEMVSKLQSALDAMKTGGSEDPDPKAQAEKVTAMEATIQTLASDVSSLKEDVQARDKQGVIDRATAEGKEVSLSADAVKKLSIDDLRAHVEKLPVTVPLSARTPKVHVGARDAATLMAEYNAIKDPDQRADFWAKHREKLFGSN